MKKKMCDNLGKNTRVMALFPCLLATGCIEPFLAESITLESAVVIDATITNEMKFQEIRLSRSFAFEEDGPRGESTARVSVVDGQGATYPFGEAGQGLYRSETAFAAQDGSVYQLYVTTSDGRTYTSDPVLLSPEAEIEELYAERTTNDDGVEGMAIRVNSRDLFGDARNYRYEFTETYKIIAPDWAPQDLLPDPDPEAFCGVVVGDIKSDEQICHASVRSRSLILTETNSFPEDRVRDFTVRFINRNNYIISHRYSILIRQLVQSEPAYTFFETLQEFSGTESLFSETQPGFLQGNVYSADDATEKVLGYFDVASVTEKRIFFNYDDFFPGDPLPPYVDPCNVSAPPLVRGQPPVCVLSLIVESNGARLVGDNANPGTSEGPYLIVPRVCGDCTAIGSTEIPVFWEEE